MGRLHARCDLRRRELKMLKTFQVLRNAGQRMFACSSICLPAGFLFKPPEAVLDGSELSVS